MCLYLANGGLFRSNGKRVKKVLTLYALCNRLLYFYLTYVVDRNFLIKILLRARTIETLIYAQTTEKGKGDSTSVPVNCTKTSTVENASVDCSLVSWGTVFPETGAGNCSAESYIGSSCRQQLLAWRDCVVGGSGDVLVDRNFKEDPQEEKERDVAQFHHFLREFSRELMSLI